MTKLHTLGATTWSPLGRSALDPGSGLMGGSCNLGALVDNEAICTGCAACCRSAAAMVGLANAIEGAAVRDAASERARG